ncbi:MAG: hypothetical protein H6782_04540 [Candidatus Nomurabacteria bacterium]|nr:MAG: hypothetical protein H6782_04540 [Candidatus Nomurabacteria bacterium]
MNNDNIYPQPESEPEYEDSCFGGRFKCNRRTILMIVLVFLVVVLALVYFLSKQPREGGAEVPVATTEEKPVSKEDLLRLMNSTSTNPEAMPTDEEREELTKLMKPSEEQTDSKVTEEEQKRQRGELQRLMQPSS